MHVCEFLRKHFERLACEHLVLGTTVLDYHFLKSFIVYLNVLDCSLGFV